MTSRNLIITTISFLLFLLFLILILKIGAFEMGRTAQVLDSMSNSYFYNKRFSRTNMNEAQWVIITNFVAEYFITFWTHNLMFLAVICILGCIGFIYVVLRLNRIENALLERKKIDDA